LLNIVVSVDTSLQAKIALEAASRLSSQVRVQPVYVYDPPSRDIEFGAGWARHSWEKETCQQAQARIENLVLTQRDHCPDIKDPVLLKGDPFTKSAEFFMQNQFDLLVVGVPFRNLDSVQLIHRFQTLARKEKKGLPLLIIRQFNPIHGAVILTDGGEAAEKALGLFLRFIPFLSAKIILIGLARAGDPSKEIQFLNLERGRAILKEKEVSAQGYTISELGYEGIKKEIETTDLLVCPVLSRDEPFNLSKFTLNKNQSGLFCIGQE